jgi:hypothetical protein
MAERTQLGELGEAAKHREKITPRCAQVWKGFEGARSVDATDVVPAKRNTQVAMGEAVGQTTQHQAWQVWCWQCSSA